VNNAKLATAGPPTFHNGRPAGTVLLAEASESAEKAVPSFDQATCAADPRRAEPSQSPVEKNPRCAKKRKQASREGL
jgi:hypothetical protein